ncbi:MAG: TonB family protein [Pseudomonadota bacterium]
MAEATYPEDLFEPRVAPKDRFTFTLFMALSLHAAIIFGVTFTDGLDVTPSPTIEVTLATHDDQAANPEADFIAEANQLASGSEAEALERTTNQSAEIFSNDIEKLLAEPEARVDETLTEQQVVVTSEAESEEQASTLEETEQLENDSPLLTRSETYEELAKEIASLEARLAQENQALAKGPRVKRLDSSSTKSAAEAAYLNMWRQRVERIGTANYPRGAVGTLRMLVILRPNGTLQDVRVLDSSGNRELDQAALRIVRLAAPYAEFPVEMRKNYEQLEIVRTWEFSKGSLDG